MYLHYLCLPLIIIMTTKCPILSVTLLHHPISYSPFPLPPPRSSLPRFHISTQDGTHNQPLPHLPAQYPAPHHAHLHQPFVAYPREKTCMTHTIRKIRLSFKTENIAIAASLGGAIFKTKRGHFNPEKIQYCAFKGVKLFEMHPNIGVNIAPLAGVTFWTFIVFRDKPIFS